MFSLKEIQKIHKSLLHSISGLVFILKHERAFQQEIVLGILIFTLLFFGSFSFYDIIIIFSSYMLILITELLNTAIEKTHDRVSTEQHPLTKIAKDVASAAVFISITNFVVIFVVIFIKNHLLS